MKKKNIVYFRSSSAQEFLVNWKPSAMSCSQIALYSCKHFAAATWHARRCPNEGSR